MRELLSSYGKRFFKWLAACAVLVVLSLAAAGEAALIGAFFIGCLAAAVCAWILVYRTWKSSGLELREAKQQMLVGMVLRLFTMFIVFWTAIQISVPVFWSVVSGFLLFSVLALLRLVLLNFPRDDKK